MRRRVLGTNLEQPEGMSLRRVNVDAIGYAKAPPAPANAPAKQPDAEQACRELLGRIPGAVMVEVHVRDSEGRVERRSYA